MSPEKLLGKQLGSYKIEAILGSGGMAVVYRALQDDGKAVALKVLFPPPSAGVEIRLRFEREARTAARLNHPGIVRVLDAGQIDDYAYLAMTYIEGQTLADHLAQQHNSPMDEATAADIAWQIADALYYAHSQGVVHRDVKPSNILLTPDGRALLTDFGVAQALDDPALTRTGHTVGTPTYMAPEQASGDQPIDGRADLYALGVVLYHIVTGRTPFQGTTPQVLHAHIYDSPPSPSSVAQVSPAMEAVILKSLAKDASQRFQTGAAMAQALANLSDQTGTQHLLPASTSAGQSLWLKRYTRWFWAIPALILAAIAIWQFNSFNQAAPPISVSNSPTPTVTNTSLPPTPTLTRSPTNTSTPATTISTLINDTATPTLTATSPPTVTPSPLPTDTPSPILPPTNTAAPPTATPCPVTINTEYSSLFGTEDNALAESLGCPRAETATTVAAWQPFEHGVMLWREDVNLIYVLEPENLWRSTGDTWREGDLAFEPAQDVPDGLHQPVRGFGLVWREQPGVREALGWATSEEDGFEAMIQEFNGGTIWQDSERNTFFVLLNNGTYQIR